MLQWRSSLLAPAAMTMKRKDVAVQMPTKPCADPISSTAVESDVTIQKLVSVCAPSDIEDAFRYDLAHVSPSLFLDDGNLRPVKRFTEIPVELLSLTVKKQSNVGVLTKFGLTLPR